jgi:hypothetical protein
MGFERIQKMQLFYGIISILLKNSSIIHFSFINFFGMYDFTNYSKKVYNLIAIDE